MRNILGGVLNKVAAKRSQIGAYGEVSANGARAIPLSPSRPRV